MMAVAPLRIGRFRYLWAASLVSNLGSFFYTVAASWLVWELTASATWVGFILAANTLPLLFLGLAAGAVADLFDRTKVMVASQVLMGVAAVAMTVISWLDQMTPGLLLALALIIGVGVAFNLPAWQALVPNLVPRGMLPSAIALNSAGFNVARAVGPALAGVVIATAGAAAAFGINAISFVGVIVVVVAIGRHLEQSRPEQGSITSAIALGIRFARFTPAFRRLLGLLALFALTSAVVQSALPSRTDELGGSAAIYGLLLGAMGAGALVAAFTRSRIMDMLGSRSLGSTIIVFGLAGVLLGVAPSVWVAGVALAVAGGCWVLSLVTLNATSQTMSPEWARGRAMSLYTLAFTGVIPIGSVLGGVLADVVGAGNAITILSGGSVVLGLATPLFRIPLLDDVAAPEFNEDANLGDHPRSLEGGPVMVSSTWTIDESDYMDFLDVMARIRLVRLSTGAYRWRLYRNVGYPNRFTEVFLVGSWAEHVAQHRRIDDASRLLIRHARSFDRDDGPLSAHLLAVDVAQPPDWAQLVDAHAELHRSDGSLPLEEPAAER
ncbi:MFS transporter [soil metagenome]